MENSTLIAFLTAHKQTHLIPFLEALSDGEREKLEKEILSVDFDAFAGAKIPAHDGEITPIRVMTADESEARRAELEEKGEKILKSGKLAALMLAGGQGTRLGSPSPKGCFDLGITRHYYLFQAHIEKLIAAREKYGVSIPIFIMTNAANYAETVSFFEEHSYFGYSRENVSFFKQNMSACTDLDGKLLMGSRSSLALSPDGNGGWYEALMLSGCGLEIERRNIDRIVLFGVDNPLQDFLNPSFIGASDGFECVMKVIRKSSPEECVGVVCLKDGRPSMVSYTELSDEMRYLQNEDGQLVYGFGDSVCYVFDRNALEACRKLRLPLHLAVKKIPFCNPDGNIVQPAAPNGLKYEKFLFDILKHIGRVLPYEVDRRREFAPVKNLTGEDSVATAQALLTENGITL